MKQYDVIIIGAGPGGIFSAYELVKKKPGMKIAVFEGGGQLSERHCPIDGVNVKKCIGCPTCSIMKGFGGAGAFSDGKYNITNDFGGTLYKHIGYDEALELMRYVDDINVAHGGQGTKLYSTSDDGFKKRCMQNKLKLLDASVRHLGTDINFVVLTALSIPVLLGFNVLDFIHPMGGDSTILDLQDFIVSNNILPLGSVLFVLFVTAKRGMQWDRFVAEVNTGAGLRLSKSLFWYFRCVLPVLVVVLLIAGYFDIFG